MMSSVVQIVFCLVTKFLSEECLLKTGKEVIGLERLAIEHILDVYCWRLS